MALKATIYKADVQVADMDRHYYQDHALTLARHPSETEERLMVRLAAFLRHADPALAFGKGLSDAEEPDLWQRDLTGAIDLWIEVGQPDERRILKACGRARKVLVYSYGNTGLVWWGQMGNRVERANNLGVFHLSAAVGSGLAALANRNMQLQCTIQDGLMWIASSTDTVQVDMSTQKELAVR
jgi:uncharacterized protein YaeQ